MKSNVVDIARRSAVGSLFIRVSSIFSGFLVSILLARVLDVEALGSYFLFLQILVLAGLFLKMGMEYSLQKVVGISAGQEEWGGVRQNLKLCLVVLLFTAIVALPSIYLSWNWLNTRLLNASGLENLAGLILLAIVTQSIITLGSSFLRGVYKPLFGVFLLDGPRQICVAIAFGIIFFLIKKTTLGVAISVYVAASIFSALLLVYVLTCWLKKHPGKTTKLSWAELLEFSKLSFPMFLQNCTSLLISSCDLWVIGIFLTTADVAVYGAVIRLTTLLLFALGIINLIIPPMIASLYAKREMRELEGLMQSVAGWSIFVVIPLLIVFLFWGGDILAVLFGDSFRLGKNILIILAIAHSVNVLVGSPGMLLQMSGHHNLLVKMSAFWALINIITNVIAVKSYGITGVSIATSVSIVGLNLSMVYLAKSRLNIRTWAKLPQRIHIGEIK